MFFFVFFFEIYEKCLPVYARDFPNALLVAFCFSQEGSFANLSAPFGAQTQLYFQVLLAPFKTASAYSEEICKKKCTLLVLALGTLIVPSKSALGGGNKYERERLKNWGNFRR